MPVPTPTAAHDLVRSRVDDRHAAALDVDGWLLMLGRAGDRLASTARTRLATDAGRARSAGVPLTAVIDAWLAAVEAGRRDGADAGSAGVAADGIRSLCAGYADGQLEEQRRRDNLRAVLLDALLSDQPAAEVQELAQRAGVDLSGRRTVLVVGVVSEAVLERLADAGALAAPRAGTVVAVISGRVPRGPETAGLGRPGLGVHGIRASHDDAVRALEVARRMGLRGIVPYGDVLPEALIGRDRDTLAELVEATLAPLRSTRSGGPQYVETAATWLQEGLSVAATARVLDVNERTVRYRLARIAKLTALDLQHADDRFRLELAIRGSRLLEPAPGA